MSAPDDEYASRLVETPYGRLNVRDIGGTGLPNAAAVSVVAEVESTTHLFTAWATTRLHWREHVTVNGDQKAAAAFLDALNLV